MSSNGRISQQNFEDDEEGLAVDTLRLPMKEISWALGKNGATKRKLARASECVIEYVGNVVYMCGTKRQRRTASVSHLEPYTA